MVVASLGLTLGTESAASVTPRAPGPPKITLETSGPTAGAVFLRWAAPTDPGTSLTTSYAFAVSTDGGVTWTAPQVLRGAAHTASSTTAPELACHNTAPGSAGCSYRIYAQNAAGTGAPSNVVATWVEPTSPASLGGFVASRSFDSVELHWPAPKITGGLPLTYDVFSSTDGGSFELVTSTRAESILVPCTGSVTCAYLVRATNSQGVSKPSAAFTVTTAPGSVSDATVILTGTDLGTGIGKARLTFGAPVSGLPAVSYEIEQCAVAPGARSGCESSSTAWSSAFVLAAPSTLPLMVPRSCRSGVATCAFRVRGENERGGVGVWHTLDVEPWAPFGVRVTRRTSSQVSVSFDGPAETGASGRSAKRYRIYLCSANCSRATSWFLGAQVAYPRTGTAPYSVGSFRCGHLPAGCSARMQFVDGTGRASPLTATATK